MKNLVVKRIRISAAKEERRIYKENFPKKERVPFNSLFHGAFAAFQMYGFFNDENDEVGFVHLANKEEFVHLNYIAVDKKFQRQGVGSRFIQWIKDEFKKPIVVDVENLDFGSSNVLQRVNRLKFYYKNGFVDGAKEFDWAGTKMFYMKTADIPDEKFMKHIVKCFPTISSIAEHKSNKEMVELYGK